MWILDLFLVFSHWEFFRSFSREILFFSASLIFFLFYLKKLNFSFFAREVTLLEFHLKNFGFPPFLATFLFFLFFFTNFLDFCFLTKKLNFLYFYDKTDFFRQKIWLFSEVEEFSLKICFFNFLLENHNSLLFSLRNLDLVPTFYYVKNWYLFLFFHTIFSFFHTIFIFNFQIQAFIKIFLLDFYLHK